MKIAIKHKVLAAVAENLQNLNDIVSSVAGQEYSMDIIAESKNDLSKKKSYTSRAVKIVNDPAKGELTVVLNDSVLIELLTAQGDLLKAVKLYTEALARIKKGSF